MKKKSERERKKGEKKKEWNGRVEIRFQRKRWKDAQFENRQIISEMANKRTDSANKSPEEGKEKTGFDQKADAKKCDGQKIEKRKKNLKMVFIGLMRIDVFCVFV